MTSKTARHTSLCFGLLLFLLPALTSMGCAEVWAQDISNKVSRDYEKIESYRGRTIELGIDAEPVTREIVYQRPWRVRVETLSPVAHAGELFLYDGQRAVYWWPQIGFGIEVLGNKPPTRGELRQHIARLTKSNLSHYAFSFRGARKSVADQASNEWRVVPTRSAPLRMPHKVWTHAKYSMPIKMVFEQAKVLWYSMEFQLLEFGIDVPASRFDFEFPDNAIVFRWDLADEGVTMERAKELMNFSVLVPSNLPKGHEIQKIVTLDHALPMLTMVMDRGATSLSLTQSRVMGPGIQLLGKSIPLKTAAGNQNATLSFMGPFATITWVQGETLLTLSGNLGFSDMIEIAESVQ